MRHTEFTWDPLKASNNNTKDRVSFEAAAVMLSGPDADRYHVEEEDRAHSADEDRYRTVGSHPKRRDLVLVVVWSIETLDEPEGRIEATRIISARTATLGERKNYEQEIRRP